MVLNLFRAPAGPNCLTCGIHLTHPAVRSYQALRKPRSQEWLCYLNPRV